MGGAQRLFEFQWPVHAKGYRWVRAGVADQRPALQGQRRPIPQGEKEFLVPHLPAGAQKILAFFYNPLRHATGLFRAFADLRPTQEAVRAFADKNGLLGDRAVQIPILLQHPKQPNTLNVGESLAAWAQQVARVRGIDIAELSYRPRQRRPEEETNAG